MVHKIRPLKYKNVIDIQKMSIVKYIEKDQIIEKETSMLD